MVAKSLLQTPDEWAARNKFLAASIGGLIATHQRHITGRALDLGCQTGKLIDLLEPTSGLEWVGIDPKIKEPQRTAVGAEVIHGWGHEIPFDDETFDCVVFANVYEHVDPHYRERTLREIHRVLTPSGILVGQLPNPHFPIESHSRLPFMGWLPVGLQKKYWRISPVGWKHDFYVVTIRDLGRRAAQAGFETLVTRNFNYPLEAIPEAVRPIVRVLQRPMAHVPWAWQFVFRKSEL